MDKQLKISPVNMEERKKLGIKPGDTVRVWQKIQEKDKVRLQAFEGLVLAQKHGGEPGATFTVRRVSSGVGIEKIFPLYSPMIDKIEITKRAKVRRAKLYHIREKAAKQIRRQMRNMRFVDITTSSDLADKEVAKKAEEEEAKAEEVKEAEKTEETKADETPAKENEEETKNDSENPVNSQNDVKAPSSGEGSEKKKDEAPEASSEEHSEKTE